MKLHSFRVTVSVKGDLAKEAEQEIITYFRKKTLYAYVVAEYGEHGKRHLHAAVVFQEPREGNDVLGYLWKIVQPHHPDSIRKHAMNKHALTNHTWYEEYLKKEQDREVLLDTYDPTGVSLYFPTEDQQRELMAQVTEVSAEKVADPYYDRLEREWIEYEPRETGYESAARFLNYIMFVARTERCISDSRRFNQVAWTLFRYRNRDLTVYTDTRQYGGQMSGNVS